MYYCAVVPHRLLDAAPQDDVVGLAAPSHVKRMERLDVPLIEATSEKRRKTFVDEEFHASSGAPRPSARPADKRVGARVGRGGLEGFRGRSGFSSMIASIVSPRFTRPATE